MTRKEMLAGFAKGKTALELTIKKYCELPKHWEDIINPKFDPNNLYDLSDHYPWRENCPLCKKHYSQKTLSCGRCPLVKDGSCSSGSLYARILAAIQNKDKKKFLATCKAMVNFLKKANKKGKK